MLQIRLRFPHQLPFLHHKEPHRPRRKHILKSITHQIHSHRHTHLFLFLILPRQHTPLPQHLWLITKTHPFPHRPLIPRMRFRNINYKKFRPILIFIIHSLKIRRMPQKRGSGNRSRNQHQQFPFLFKRFQRSHPIPFYIRYFNHSHINLISYF